MSETTVSPPSPAGEPETHDTSLVGAAPPDVSALQQAVVEALFGVIGAPDDPDALVGGARALAELDAVLAPATSGRGTAP